MHSPDYLQRRERWNKWADANPAFWRLFERFSGEAMAAGVKRTSHWLVVNRIRWEAYIVTTSQLAGGFKIPNEFIAFAARDFMHDNYPHAASLFALRHMRGEDYDLTLHECGITEESKP